MANSNSFLCIDLGAGSVKIAAFEPNDAGGLTLKAFAQQPLGLPGAQDAVREALKSPDDFAFPTRHLRRKKSTSVPGYQVFSKFSKLPPVEAKKIAEIIQLDAQNNIPFPIEEVVWDHQVIGASSDSELEILLVAIKSKLVDRVFNAVGALPGSRWTWWIPSNGPMQRLPS